MLGSHSGECSKRLEDIIIESASCDVMLSVEDLCLWHVSPSPFVRVSQMPSVRTAVQTTQRSLADYQISIVPEHDDFGSLDVV